MEKPKRQKRSKEEIYIANMEKEERKRVRAEKKAEKDKIKAEKKKERDNPVSEETLVHRYVNRTLNNQRNHGRVDNKKFKDLAYEHKVNKNIWMDNDFYFSMVFESSEQKYKFLEALGFYEEDAEEMKLANRNVRIINGLEFANRLKDKGVNIELEEVQAIDNYPKPDLALLPYVLDNETLE